MDDNTVASRLLAVGTPTLWISTNVTKDADSDYSGTISGTLLLFMFTKKTSIVVNFDVDISYLFIHSRLAGAILNSPHIWIVSSNESANGKALRKAIETHFPTNDLGLHDYNKTKISCSIFSNDVKVKNIWTHRLAVFAILLPTTFVESRPRVLRVTVTSQFKQFYYEKI